MELDIPFTFIDLFSGIGGFHLALESLGGICVCASENNPFARSTYETNFRPKNPELFSKGLFLDDITLEKEQEKIPKEFDLLCAGFPCQPFSQAGFKLGFNEARGTLFYEIAKIIKSRSPKICILENVRHLLRHDGGRTFDVIKNILDNLGYDVHFQILKASDYGLPTHRPRLFICAFRRDLKVARFLFPQPKPLIKTMSTIFGSSCSKKIGFTLRVGGRGSGFSDRHNWDSYMVSGEERRLSLNEAKEMMGFPRHFHFPVSTTQAFKQLGNSVAVDVVRAIAQKILDEAEERT